MGPMGNGDTGDNGVQGTWVMRPTGAKWYRGYGYRGYGAHTWAMGHMDDVAQGTMGYRGMGYRGYGAHGQWGT